MIRSHHLTLCAASALIVMSAAARAGPNAPGAVELSDGTQVPQVLSEPRPVAQTQPATGQPDKSDTGRTQTPEIKGVKQPQGWTGPTDTDTTTGGAPATSPQGQSPPGMQAAPEGSSKTTIAPDASDGKR
jgi:hypothetical protein